jgi:Putative Flp pilus-assembly TadE/G-like
MKSSSQRSWLDVRAGYRQRGQALVYGLFILGSGLAALFFLFNMGQLTREKSKLVNTADAVAYSAGVMHARTLNYQAYTNRAMMANTVAIAQLISLSSWLEYADSVGGTMGQITFDLDPRKYPFYYPSYLIAQTTASSIRSALDNSGGGSVLQGLASTSDTIIEALAASQLAAHVGLLAQRTSVLDAVAQANYRNDGTVTIDHNFSRWASLTLDPYASFVQRYEDSDRTRFAEVAGAAKDRDGFMRTRNWLSPMPAIPFMGVQCYSANVAGRMDFVVRSGGTELLGFDEWKAADVMSEYRWVPKSKTDVLCQAVAETPIAWASPSAADNATSFDTDFNHYNMALIRNPLSTSAAFTVSSRSWAYNGLPSFYDLDQDILNDTSNRDPRLEYSVRLLRNRAQLMTSEGRSEVRPSTNLNSYQANIAGGDDVVAVSTSEVFFERRDGRQEIGSLFNPYWHVRLIDSRASVRAAQLLQGVVTP